MNKSRQIFWHVTVWAVLILFFMFIMRDIAKMSLRHILIEFLLFGLINISLFYINYLFLIPKFLNKKRYSTYFLTVFGAIVIYGLIKYGFSILLKDDMPIRMRRPGPIREIGFWFHFLNTLFTSILFVFFSIVLKLTRDWFVSERIQRDLENQRLSAELSFLKSQINPHFLFNSLNSIYSLAYQKSDTTPDAILKLSEIMRYMLYECNDNKVDLTKELQYLQNFIDLQKLRLGNKAHIDFKIEGNVTNQKIVPLLLIAFIENAFKHGIASDETSPIKLLISVNQEHLQFYIQNKKHNNNMDSVGGIGLNNVKRRLDLLYPGKYNLDVRDEKDTYTCELSLVL